MISSHIPMLLIDGIVRDNKESKKREYMDSGNLSMPPVMPQTEFFRPHDDFFALFMIASGQAL